MESASILQGIAEVAIGLAGFAGVAAGAIFACFMPYAIYYLGVESPWRIASVLCLYVPIQGLITQTKIIRFSPNGYSWPAMLFLTSMEVAILLLLLTVSLGKGGNYDFGLYLSATLLILAISSFLFYRLLETSFSSGVDGGNKVDETPNDDSTDSDGKNLSESVKFYQIDK